MPLIHACPIGEDGDGDDLVRVLIGQEECQPVLAMVPDRFAEALNDQLLARFEIGRLELVDIDDNGIAGLRRGQAFLRCGGGEEA
jgi:hypothetical protein